MPKTTASRAWLLAVMSPLWLCAPLVGAEPAANVSKPDEAKPVEPAAVRLARYLPPTAPLFVSTADPARCEAAWRLASFFEAYEDESMQPFWAEVRRKHGGVLPTECLGLRWATLTAAGPAGAAYALWPSKDGALRSVVLASAASGSSNDIAGDARLPALFDTLRTEWTRQGFEVTERHAGKIRVLEGVFASEPAKGAPAPPVRSPAPPGIKKPAAKAPAASVAAAPRGSLPERAAFAWREMLVTCDSRRGRRNFGVL